MPIKTKISFIALSLSVCLSSAVYAAPSPINYASPSEPVAQKANSESEKANALFEIFSWKTY